jgi:predicted DNA-binding transcriptional regulator YafY
MLVSLEPWVPRPRRVSRQHQTFTPTTPRVKIARPTRIVETMNRTERLYAIVEELRAVAPRARSARWLAERFEVTTRTIERDVSALQQTGNPIWAEPGRTGGYCIDRERTLPPVNFTAQEAVALAVAVEGMSNNPFEQAAQAAMRKVIAAMHVNDAAAARALAARVHVLGADENEADSAESAVPALIADALSTDFVLRIGYLDRDDALTTRDIEPLGYIRNSDHWYLVAWCRRREATRAFRTDRIRSVVRTAEPRVPRELRVESLEIPYGRVRTLDPL